MYNSCLCFGFFVSLARGAVLEGPEPPGVLRSPGADEWKFSQMFGERREVKARGVREAHGEPPAPLGQPCG